jgi:hypothetical protein
VALTYPQKRAFGPKIFALASPLLLFFAIFLRFLTLPSRTPFTAHLCSNHCYCGGGCCCQSGSMLVSEREWPESGSEITSLRNAHPLVILGHCFSFDTRAVNSIALVPTLHFSPSSPWTYAPVNYSHSLSVANSGVRTMV